MHVLMVSDVFFPRINGVSTSIATFLASFQSLGVRCTLIAPRYGADDDCGAGVATRTIRVPAWAVPLDPEDRLMRCAALSDALASIEPRHIDLVHVQTPFVAHRAGVRFARRHGLAVVETCHTHFEEYFHHYLSWLPGPALRAAARALSRRQCNALDAIIVPSPAMRAVLNDYGVERPIEVLPTGLDLSLFARGDGARFRREHGIPARRRVMVVVSRVAHEKNIDFLIDVVDRVRYDIPDVLLVIAGEGPAESHLRRLVVRRGLGQHVIFVGYLDRRGGLQDCYCAADLFVFASRSETQGLVLLEALALGVPVLALAQLGTREIVAPQRGALAAPDDPAGFAAAAVQLLGDPEQRVAMGEEARRFACEWSTVEMAKRLRSFYARTLLGTATGYPVAITGAGQSSVSTNRWTT
jgi:1,2-diacylglycerol 3-alpha-glucosyltransferase